MGTFWGCLACLGGWAAPGAVPEAFLRESFFSFYYWLIVCAMAVDDPCCDSDNVLDHNISIELIIILGSLDVFGAPWRRGALEVRTVLTLCSRRRPRPRLV